MLDLYSKGKGYQPFVTEDLAGGQFTEAPNFSFPFHFRHGSILPLDAAEYDLLEATPRETGFE